MSRVTVELHPEVEQRLRRKAEGRGQSLEQYIEHLAERDAETSRAASSFDEMLRPVREKFAESGMTDTELADLVEEAREEVWQARQARKTP